ncbi:hypothetical protein P8C59_003862 [Phyllachora maydis]|uniref:Uncharacterized protein n=1 Tax=Phyllachora maydis TaxID=1825666 RepID=A0AAD9I1K1_9PEZI|nr:hypothetical protein P8C59_003862 [Phyllachora maydis]
MTSVVTTDFAKLLQSRKADRSSIVLSRKRKLRELLSVASTDDDEIPNHDFDNTDAPSASTTETKLLHSSEALQRRTCGERDDEVIFGLQRSQASDQLLEELPLYGVPLSVPKADLAGPDFDPDAHWKRRALPLSK